MKEIKKHLNMEKINVHRMEKFNIKIETLPQFFQKIKHNSYHCHFYRNWQANPKFYIEIQLTRIFKRALRKKN
jgi:hypothetical protein